MHAFCNANLCSTFEKLFLLEIERRVSSDKVWINEIIEMEKQEKINQ